MLGIDMTYVVGGSIMVALAIILSIICYSLPKDTNHGHRTNPWRGDNGTR